MEDSNRPALTSLASALARAWSGARPNPSPTRGGLAPHPSKPIGRSAVRAARVGACLVAALSGAAQAQTGLRVGTIEIRTVDVFSAEEAERGWIYRAANALHETTRETTVRRLLLFAEGDFFDPERLAETERNLRASGFFKRASVVAGEPHDGVVDVVVETQDAWTMQIGIGIGRDGGQMRSGISLGEKNLLGTGRELSVAYGEDVFRSYRSVEFSDAHFLLPYGRAHVIYAVNSDGGEKLLEFERPFYSVGAAWSGAARYHDLEREEPLYRGGEEVLRYRHDDREVFGGWAIAARASPAAALRFGIGFDSREERFAPLPGSQAIPLAEERRYRDVFLQVEALRPDFVTWNYVNQDLQFEDFNLGPRLLVAFGVSPRAFGVPVTSTMARLDASAGFRLGGGAFVLARVTGTGRFEPGPRNTTVEGQISFVRRFATGWPQTFIARVSGAKGWNLDADRLFYADGATGLRAYPLYAFEGDRRVLANVEHRVFCGCELMQFLAPGVAAFVDAGTAVPPGQPLRWADVKVDAGVGLRFAITRTTATFRVDIGYAFKPDPRGRRGWLVSFSGGQAF